MTDLDQDVERLDAQENVVAYVRRAPGIAILVGLFVLAGMIHLIAGIAAWIGAATPGSIFDTSPALAALFPNVLPAGSLGIVYAIVGILLAVLAAAEFVASWALWDLRSWAWGFALGLSIAGFILSPFGLLLGVLRIVYLSMRDVRASYSEEDAVYRVVAARRAGRVQ